MARRKEVCNKCSDFLNTELRDNDSGKELDMLTGHFNRVMKQYQKKPCEKLCVPTIETALWYEAIKRKEHHG